jgi:hypothetical protein
VNEVSRLSLEVATLKSIVILTYDVQDKWPDVIKRTMTTYGEKTRGVKNHGLGAAYLHATIVLIREMVKFEGLDEPTKTILNNFQQKASMGDIADLVSSCRATPCHQGGWNVCISKGPAVDHVKDFKDVWEAMVMALKRYPRRVGPAPRGSNQRALDKWTSELKDKNKGKDKDDL